MKPHNLRLPAGISGFYEKGRPNTSTIDFNLFKTACEKASQTTTYSLFNVNDQSGTDNLSYHLAIFKEGESNYLVTCNKYFPIIAISKVMGADLGLVGTDSGVGLPENEYMNQEGLAKAFTDPFLVLPKEILEMEVNADNPENAKIVQELTDYEFAEFSFWKPKVIGDIIFNNWIKKD